MEKPEIYVSTDIETDGPAPGINSMLSFASAAFLKDKTCLGTFSANLHTLPECTPNPVTEAFWAKFPEAYAKSRENCESAESAMKRYVEWVKSLPGKPQFVGYPAGFDFSFMYYYMMRFAGESPFSCACIDIKTYVMALLQKEFREVRRDSLPREWFSPDHPHTHVALDDALEQGLLFCEMLGVGLEREG